MLTEYPKQLYRSGWDNLDDSIVVHDEGEEAAARKEGYKMLSESETDKKTKK